MVYYLDDIDEEREDELQTILLDEPGPCIICQKPDCHYGCFRCGRPVCYHATDYQADSTCGGWIMDWWGNGAYDGNEFWCKACLEAESEPAADG